MSTNYLIKVTDFSKKYGMTEINIAELVIKERITLIVGENGSGKSTLLKAIVGLINYDGNIEKDCTIGYMSEFPPFPLDVEVNQFLTQLSTFDKQSNHYLDLVIEFDLVDKLDRKISSLSKGMRAKLNLIQCLMLNRDLYILDEPLSGLDYESINELIQHIKNSPKAFLISSHISESFEELNKVVITL